MPRGASKTVAAGFVSVLCLNLIVATTALLIAEHWNGRGGEEAAVAIVVLAAVCTALAGVTVLVEGGNRRLGVGVLLAAALAPLVDVVLFFAYILGIQGQDLS